MRHSVTAPGLLSLLLGATPALPATYVIAPDGTGDFPTIQDAVDAAADGDEVLLEDGTFLGPGNRDVDFLGKALTIRSLSGVRSACVIDCENAASSGFRFQSGEGSASVLADLTVTRSHILSQAVQALSSSPTVRNVAVTAPGRTGMYAEYGAPVITGCLVESNTGATTYTAGISLLSATSTIEDCSFRDFEGACILAWGGTTTIRRCDFQGNDGGAIGVWRGLSSTDASATVEDCTITNNRGIGLYLAGGGTSSFTVRGCTITGNTPGAWLGSSGTVPIIVQNCDIGGNAGSGLHVQGTAGASLSDNEIHQNGGTGLDVGGGTGELAIERCNLQGNGGEGAHVSWVATTTRPVVRDCTARGNGASGFYVAGNPLVESCTVQGNAAAGITAHGADGANVRQCLITGNARGFDVSNSAALTVEDCTVASNHAAFSGGAMTVIGSGVTVLRSILWGNCSDADGYEIWQTSGSSVQLSCVNVEAARLRVFGAGTFTLTDLLEQDPLLCSPEACASAPSTGGLYGLSPDSPALAQACGPMGAPQPLCTAVGVQQSLEPTSWGKVKAMYRN